MLTTSQKITASFVIVIAIMGVLAYVSYSGLTEANEGYANSSRLYVIDVASSDTGRIFNRATTDVEMFVRTANPASLEDAQNNLKDALSIVEGAINTSTSANDKVELAVVQQAIRAYANNLTDRGRYRINSINDFQDNVRPAIAGIESGLNEIAALAYRASHVEVLNGIATSWPILTDFRTVSNRFIETEELVDGEASAENLVALGLILREMETVLTSYEDRVVYAKIYEAYNKLNTGFLSTRERVVNSRNASLEAAVLLAEAREAVDKFHSMFTAFRTQEDAAYVISSEATVRGALIMTMIGIIIAGVLAFVIIMSMNKTFKKLSVYFSRIADGDFDAESGVTEKGAIGAMVESTEGIPRTLNSIIENTNALAHKIVQGAFRERLDTSQLKGGFATIGNATNTVANSYMDVLDSIPNPIMTCDQQKKIMFLNKGAQGTLGGNKIGQKCADLFGAKECTSSECFGLKSCASKSMTSGTTAIDLNKKAMDINVMAAPLVDNAGNVVGFLEIMTDLTEIKTKERFILKAAIEASDIADRVATASEQLSAQFEQISRGTDQQKSQVESTASAMSEMNSTVLEVARNAGQASTQTDDTRHKADSGAALVGNAVKSINDVNNIANTLQTNMQELGTQAENIGSVMNVISDIADQTNLLALNAAIEAARAGDAGRGFAVVADEVRKLAEKTMTATHEVGESISSIQSSARVNIDQMAVAISSVSDATGLANDSAQALEEIVHLAAANSEIVTSIATAAEEQSATSEEINVAIEEISRIVTEITESMEQSTGAVRELSGMSQDLRSLMEKLR